MKITDHIDQNLYYNSNNFHNHKLKFCFANDRSQKKNVQSQGTEKSITPILVPGSQCLSRATALFFHKNSPWIICSVPLIKRHVF